MRKIGLLIGTCAAFLVMDDRPVAAQSSVSAEEATRRVNIAGRQRMLSQRMTKAACLISQGIAPEAAMAEVEAAFSLFVASDSALREGDPAMGLSPETERAVAEALARTEAPWASFRDLIARGITSGSFAPYQMAALDEAGLALLQEMNLAVFETARVYADAGIGMPEGQTITVDVAGRQRMLSQRAVKEACMMRVASDPAIYAAQLAETVQLFDLSLSALQVGYDQVGVIAAPTDAVTEKLDQVRMLWGPVKELLDRAAGGSVLDDAELALLQTRTEGLLQVMDEAVGLYEIGTE